MMNKVSPETKRVSDLRENVELMERAPYLQPTRGDVRPEHINELLKQDEWGGGHDPIMAMLAQFGPATVGRGPTALKALLNMLPDSVKKQMNVF